MSYILSQEELRSVQLVQLEMLEEVDRICKKFDIKYNIIAGTLLGAVRHGGYIPWDDDADVALLREEYEKFRDVCETELDKSRFYFQDHRNTPGYRWGYGKLRRKNTLFLREYQEHMPYEQGIFIDIFPMDHVSDKRTIRAIQNFKLFCVRKLMWAPVGKVACKSSILRIWYRVLSIFPENKLYGIYEGLIRKYNQKKSGWVRILTFPTPNNEYGYKKKWYLKSKEIIFENRSFQGIEEYDEYLKFKFGNYMQLPPKELQKTHPVTSLQICIGESEGL